ncbi:MAG: serine hydrolase, partial [Pseudomonadota bacterium]
IRVDGKLNDWPSDPKFFPIRYNGDQETVPGDEGFDAQFTAGFDPIENRLFLAVKITDDVHVATDSDDADWERLDGVIAYVDFNHTTTGSGSALYFASGKNRELMSGESSWDATVASMDWDGVDVAVARDGNTTVYEWRFESPVDFDSGMVLGLDFLVADQDAEDANTSARLFSWGSGFGKSQAGGRTGDLLLVGPDDALGTVSGEIAMSGIEQEDDAQLRVRLQSDSEPRRWVQVLADEQGRYSVDLPADRYTLSSADRMIRVENEIHAIALADPATVRVRAGRTVDVPALEIVAQPFPVEFPERGALFEFSEDDHAAFDQVVERLMAHFSIPGASLALIKDGELELHRTYGVQDASTGEPVSANTVFEAASITKPVFAFAVNRMAERGEIDLDRPLYQYLEFEDIAHDERYKKITARHVLSHQTGFPNWRYMNDDGQLDIKFYPGIQYGYSGEGFEYLGRVVSKIKGEPLEDIVRRETVDVMGFTTNTFFADGPQLREQVSRGHLAGFAGPHGFPEEIGVAHSMYTEARTFSNFMINLLKQEGLSEAGYAAMLEPQVAIPSDDGDIPNWPNRFGLGFHLMNSPFGLVYGHGGNNGNFTCQFELYPEHDLGFVVFTNGDTGWQFANALRDYLIIGRSEAADESET